MIGELHDELLPDHACGAKDANVYSAAGNHYVLHSESAEAPAGKKKPAGC
jgi:hypothetical protein